MKVSEIFLSIDGEGINAGKLAVFIRLFGCNLNCSWCDSRYAICGSDFREMTVDQVIEKAESFNIKSVTLTGGEPLIHEQIDELITGLIERGFQVNLETNGAVDISKYVRMDGVLITMDLKCPSSRMENRMMFQNIEKMRQADVLKAVVTESDLGYLKNKLIEMKPRCHIFLSPVFGAIQPVKLVEFLKSLSCHPETNELSQQIRVQMQLHKIIWNCWQRGV